MSGLSGFALIFKWISVLIFWRLHWHLIKKMLNFQVQNWLHSLNQFVYLDEPLKWVCYEFVKLFLINLLPLKSQNESKKSFIKLHSKLWPHSIAKKSTVWQLNKRKDRGLFSTPPFFFFLLLTTAAGLHLKEWRINISIFL